jgi:hypothetical protein
MCHPATASRASPPAIGTPGPLSGARLRLIEHARISPEYNDFANYEHLLVSGWCAIGCPGGRTPADSGASTAV